MNRIDKKFKELRKKKKKAFISFITAGDPSLRKTEELVLAFDKAGVDIVELGVPFSDPLADGPTIQASSQRALKRKVNIGSIFQSVKKIRRSSDVPIALMTYYNPVFHYGEKRFIDDARKAGVDGVIVPDLPPEEAGGLIRYARESDVSTIFFLSLTTTEKRMKRIVRASTGFVYFVSLTGVTGARNKLSSTLLKKVQKAQKLTRKPICVGFGVSTAREVRSIARVADGVIVGSAIVKEIEKNTGKKDMVQRAARLVKRLRI